MYLDHTTYPHKFFLPYISARIYLSMLREGSLSHLEKFSILIDNQVLI